MRKLLLCFLLLSAQAVADERILEFHSEILVMSDGWIDVTETIKDRADATPMRGGNERDYPADSRDHSESDYVAG